jgi:hypothetical protein
LPGKDAPKRRVLQRLVQGMLGSELLFEFRAGAIVVIDDRDFRHLEEFQLA